MLDINADAAAAVAQEITSAGGTATAVTVDVSDRPAIEAALAEVRSTLGPVEIMVTSAGIEGFEAFLDITAEAWDRMMAVNLTGTFHCLQAAVPDMIEAGWGRIVTISSSSAQSGNAANVPLRGVQGRRHRLHEGAGPRPGADIASR